MAKKIGRFLSAPAQHLLRDALQDGYPKMVTGFLVDVRFSGHCVHGYSAQCYPEGALLITGEITRALQYSGRWLICTEDLQFFVIVSFSRDGMASLLQLLERYEPAHTSQSHWCLR